MLGALKTVFWPQAARNVDAPAPALENLAGDRRKAKLRDVKAEDYPTPEKYLEGAEIPTFYQFQSNMVADEDLKPGMCSGLEVDKRLTLPTRTHIRFLVTGQDVIHSFSIPSLGLKTDATPGRINRTGSNGRCRRPVPQRAPAPVRARLLQHQHRRKVSRLPPRLLRRLPAVLVGEATVPGATSPSRERRLRRRGRTKLPSEQLQTMAIVRQSGLSSAGVVLAFLLSQNEIAREAWHARALDSRCRVDE